MNETADLQRMRTQIPDRRMVLKRKCSYGPGAPWPWAGDGRGGGQVPIAAAKNRMNEEAKKKKHEAATKIQ
jgi:hypothetical protein